MAGSLNHIVEDDGSFTMEFIENLGDAREALEECFEIIEYLAKGMPGHACAILGFVIPQDDTGRRRRMLPKAEWPKDRR